MISRSDLAPGLYGAYERWLTDDQLRAIADHLKSIDLIWTRFSKITPADHIEGALAQDLTGAVIEFVVRQRWVMSGKDNVEVVQLLRRMAGTEQKERDR